MKKSKFLWILTGIIIAANLLLSFITNPESPVMMVVNDLLPIICAFIAIVSLFVANQKLEELDFTKKAWLLIFLGIVLYFLAESLYAILELWFQMDMNENFPSMADIFWCTGYIPLFIGLGMMFFGYKRSGFPMGNIKLYIIVGGFLVIIMACVIGLILVPIIQDPESTTLTKVFSLFYPIADLFIALPALLLMIITSQFGQGKISRPWRYLALGFILFTVADLIYSYTSWVGTYQSGGLTDIVWNLGYLLLAISGIYQMELLESIEEA